MAHLNNRTPDFPDFDAYPGPAPGARLLPPANGGRMEKAAERVGGAVGAAVNVARRLPQQVGSVSSSVARELKHNLILVKGRGAAHLSAAAAEIRRSAEASFAEARSRAEELTRQTRDRADHVASEYPLQVLAGAAGVAFLLGVTLRVWRDRRG